MTILAPALAPKRGVTSTPHPVFGGKHVSPAHTVEDGIEFIVESLNAADRDGDMFFGPQLLAEVSGPMLRVRFPLAVPTAEQASATIDGYTLFTEGHYAVALPTAEWLSHPAVHYAPGGIDNELRLFSWVLEPGALERVEAAGVTRAYTQVAWAVGIRTLDGLLDAWDSGMPVEYLLAMDGAL